MVDINKLYGTTDAKVWAEEFVKAYNSSVDFKINIELMIAWFANAIEIGKMRGYKQGYNQATQDANNENLGAVCCEC